MVFNLESDGLAGGARVTRVVDRVAEKEDSDVISEYDDVVEGASEDCEAFAETLPGEVDLRLGGVSCRPRDDELSRLFGSRLGVDGDLGAGDLADPSPLIGFGFCFREVWPTASSELIIRSNLPPSDC
jgi:hypothetical protein